MRFARRFARVAAVAGIAALTAGIGGCSRHRFHHEPGVIQVDIETSPTSIDPRFATDAISSRLNELIFDSLVKIDSDGRFVGDLAESVERTAPTRLIFHLRHGVRFSDGRELTARDVKYTYDSIMAPANLSLKRAGMQQLANITAPDDYTVVMTTREVYAPALEIAMQGVVPEGTRAPSRGSSSGPSGSGPFRLARFSRDESAYLERNPFRPHPEASPRAILFKIVPDPTVRALELAEGECDLSENNIQPDLLP
ncbi:MAG TPA: ABC transporter substrate-binding protein, partial [Candidatus Binataceae bacterium]